MVLQLNVEKRDIFGKKLKGSRAEGKLPVVLYGKNKETTSLFVNSIEFEKILRQAGESSVIELNEGGKKVADVLIHDFTNEPIKGAFVHADFYAVDMNNIIEATVPLVFEGIAPAEKTLGGILVKVIHEVEVEALPASLPHELTVDLSKLGTFEDRIMVGDIKLPDGVKMLTKSDEIVVLAEEYKEDVVAEAMDMSKIEVEKKGKKEEVVPEVNA